LTAFGPSRSNVVKISGVKRHDFPGFCDLMLGFSLGIGHLALGILYSLGFSYSSFFCELGASSVITLHKYLKRITVPFFAPGQKLMSLVLRDLSLVILSSFGFTHSSFFLDVAI
jgi:hypothetical protein